MLYSKPVLAKVITFWVAYSRRQSWSDLLFGEVFSKLSLNLGTLSSVCLSVWFQPGVSNGWWWCSGQQHVNSDIGLEVIKCVRVDVSVHRSLLRLAVVVYPHQQKGRSANRRQRVFTLSIRISAACFPTALCFSAVIWELYLACLFLNKAHNPPLELSGIVLWGGCSLGQGRSLPVPDLDDRASAFGGVVRQ